MAICKTENLTRAEAQTACKKTPNHSAQVRRHNTGEAPISSKDQGSRWFFDKAEDQPIHKGERGQDEQISGAEGSDSVSKDFGKNYSRKAAKAQER